MKSMMKTLPVILLGNLLYAIGVAFFILPSGLIVGGTTGIALVLNEVFGITVSGFVSIFNIVMFLLGLLILGKTFAATTLVSSFAYPFFLGCLQKLAGDFVLTEDLLLCALFGGLCIGVAIAMILRLGASTGGMDIPPLILKQLFGIPVSISFYAFDVIILLAQVFFFEKEHVLYGILLSIIYTLTMDKVMALGDSRYQLEIVSEKHEEIRQAIIAELDRTVTLLYGKSGYRNVEIDVLLCVIAPRELHKTERLIKEIDPLAFIVLSRVNKVSGRGFTAEKEYLEPR